MNADESTATVQTLLKNALEFSSRIFDKKSDDNYLFQVLVEKC